jgi:hypothetical protein
MAHAPSHATTSSFSHATAASLAKMQRAIKPGGAAIDLDMNNGAGDVRDRDFSAYEA